VQYQNLSLNFIKNIKKGFMTSNPKKHNYSTMWNPDLLIGYYQRINTKKFLIKEKSVSTNKSCYFINFPTYVKTTRSLLKENNGWWIRTIVKNNKINYSDIWILNIDLLINQDNENNIAKNHQKGEENLIIKEKMLIEREVNKCILCYLRNTKYNNHKN
jgi:hypothetical protein